MSCGDNPAKMYWYVLINNSWCLENIHQIWKMVIKRCAITQMQGVRKNAFCITAYTSIWHFQSHPMSFFLKMVSRCFKTWNTPTHCTIQCTYCIWITQYSLMNPVIYTITKVKLSIQDVSVIFSLAQHCSTCHRSDKQITQDHKQSNALFRWA